MAIERDYTANARAARRAPVDHHNRHERGRMGESERKTAAGDGARNAADRRRRTEHARPGPQKLGTLKVTQNEAR